MPNWFEPMAQTFEYYIVDPATWMDSAKINNVKSCTITRDAGADTLGSATFDIEDDVGECYIRVYLITIQNGLREKHPLGTFLVQTTPSSFDGHRKLATLEAYTPLLELKEKPLPIGYSLRKNENIMQNAYSVTRDAIRAPVVETTHEKTLYSDFVANPDDNTLTYVRDLIAQAEYELTLDELGRVLYSPKQHLESLQPVVTFEDGVNSIMYPDLTDDHDLYGIPNVVEVSYSNSDVHHYAKAVNDDPDSPTSVMNRGREIPRRLNNPSTIGVPSQEYIEEYARLALKELSVLTHTVTYTHGYYPNRLGDCVRLSYYRAKLVDVKAKVIHQSIKCEPGCPVTEKAIYIKEFWR